MLVDTHCHLADQAFDDDRPDVVARAAAAGVDHVVVVADTLETTRQACELAAAFDFSATAGVHPHHADAWTAETAARIADALDDPAVVAVGETGLDYHYDFADRGAQRRAFAAQLALGAARGRPVVVHAREADADVAAMLRDADAVVVLHSFSSGRAVLEAALELGCYVSFSGMVTFANWHHADTVNAVPADRLLLETDSPYLAPVPHRGKRNEPAFVREVAYRVAELRDTPVERLATLTTENAMRCFGGRVAHHRTSLP